MKDFQAKRVTKRYTHEIKGAPSEVFPLLCPTREYDWIDGWTCRMVYSESGYAENNCIFTTSFARQAEEMFVVSRYDPEHYVIEFVVISPETHVTKFDISLDDCGDQTTRINWAHTLTGLTEKGNALVEDYTEKNYTAIMSRLSEALDHYCKTGKMLKRHSILGLLHAIGHK